MRSDASRSPRAARAAKRTRTTPDRASLAWALSRRSGFERTLLALVLLERLSPEEAAHAVGLPLAQFERSFDVLLTELGHEARAARVSAAQRRAATAPVRLRRAA